MISVVVPTFNAEDDLTKALASLVSAAVDGLVSEVIVADGGSRDRTLRIAEDAGAKILRLTKGRGMQLRHGAKEARQPWLLFLHADTVLQEGWENEVWAIVEAKQRNSRSEQAFAFRYALDDQGILPRLMESIVSFRANVMKLPYGDQGLLISRALYDQVGGYKPLPLMEDVDIIRRLGWRRVKLLRSCALTSAIRYRRDGYCWRIARNQLCLFAYLIGISPDRIARFYFGSKPSG